ncbi:hypothetical protein BD410DRAFT_843590 [Rickenella mellea]|uniref:Transmembrane protein n=1 Tax=Rickenella mellea TaxID=50990 RepID=A0A4Y7PPS4_9AGAM|nr:hypothetical protein BD410DRAFT_843590 [Rickenella mellea]
MIDNEKDSPAPLTIPLNLTTSVADEYDMPTLTKNEGMSPIITNPLTDTTAEPVPAETRQPMSPSKRDSFDDCVLVEVPLLRQFTDTILLSDADAQDIERKEKHETCVKLLVFPVVGTIFIIFHHFFCRTLSHHPALAMTFTVRGFTIQPTWALTIGNGIAWVVQFFFTLAIGIVLVQRLWYTLHRQCFTLKELDDIFDIQSAFWKKTPIFRVTGLAFLAVISLGMGAFISTFAPASLSVGNRPLPASCNIKTVDFKNSTMLVGSTPSPAITELAIRTLESASYLPPSSDPCTDCTYNVSYTAPVLTCSNINMSSSPFLPDNVNNTVLWNSTHAIDPVKGDVNIFVWSREGSFQYGNYTNPQVILCTAQNGSYEVSISHGNGTSANATWQIIPSYSDPSGNATQEQLAFDAVMLALGVALQGPLNVITTDANAVSVQQETLVSSSPLGTLTQNTWTLNGDLLTTLPMLMQNVSIGLLAGSVTVDASSSSLIQQAGSICSRQAVVYIYDRTRLLLVYLVALLVTMICVMFGIHSVLRRKGGSTTFSNLVNAILSPELIERHQESPGGKLPLDTVISAADGRFVPHFGTGALKHRRGTSTEKV